MSDLARILSSLRRPRMLIRAARSGQTDYRRDRDLRRFVSFPASPEAAVAKLLEVENKMEQVRQSGDATYSISRHIEVMIALIAEAHSLHTKA